MSQIIGGGGAFPTPMLSKQVNYFRKYSWLFLEKTFSYFGGILFRRASSRYANSNKVSRLLMQYKCLSITLFS